MPQTVLGRSLPFLSGVLLTLSFTVGCGDDAGTSAKRDSASALDSASSDSAVSDSGGADSASADSATGDLGGSLDHGATSLTWSGFAQPFLQKYCLSCHGAGGSAHRMDTYAQVKSDSAKIRCGVAATKQSGCGSSPAPKQFPIGSGPKPTDAERSKMVAWIDAGLPK